MDRSHQLSLWQGCEILQTHEAMFSHMATRVMSYKSNYYDPVEGATKIPWYLVAGLDMREEDFNHNAYLGNGDALWRPTIHVPRGRGPFKTWFSGAIDALQHVDHLAPSFGQGEHWDIVTVLIAAEKFNGLGYFHLGQHPSPYIWAGTSRQVHGKFTSDGHYDSSAWDVQPGVAGLFLALKKHYNVSLNEA